MAFTWQAKVLSQYLRDDPCSDRVAALTDGEAKFLLHGDGGDQFCRDRYGVSWHDHLHILRELDDAGDVGGTEVELGLVTVEEGGVTATLIFGQDVDFALELRFGCDRTGLG